MKVLIRNVVLLMIIGIISSTAIAKEINQTKSAEQSLVTSVIERTITYQGILKTSSGTPVPNNTYNLTFRIYKQSSGGSALWTSVAIPVITSGGLFSTLLGPISLPFDTTYYVSIQIAGDVEMTRQIMTMSPYSASADTANYAKAAIGDSKWSFQITDSADTTLISGGQWGLARSGNILYGNADSTHVNLGVQSITGSSGNNNKYCAVGGGLGNYSKGEGATISGGVGNVANGHYSSIGGGGYNTTNQNYSVIGGGTSSTVGGHYSAIAGGGYNTISSGTNYSTIGGGDSNTVSQGFSAISGGHQNTASGFYSSIGGGSSNTASGSYSATGGGKSDTIKAIYGGVASGYSNLAGDASTDTGAFVGGGYDNSVTAAYAAVAGGRSNTSSGIYNFVGGGVSNNAGGSSSSIGGGNANSISTPSGTIGGGEYNHINAQYGSIGGGDRDTVSGVFGGAFSGHGNRAGDAPTDTAAFVGGGWNNKAIGPYSFISGGNYNTASGWAAGVCGGNVNTASGTQAIIGGGTGNVASGGGSTIGGGSSNTASGSRSSICGGINDTAAAEGSFIGGGNHNVTRNPAAHYANILGGVDNRNDGLYSTIANGYLNTITSSAQFAFAFGSGITITGNNTAVFFSGNFNGKLGINRDDNWGLSNVITCGTNTLNGNGAYLTSGGTWTNSSSRTFKENFTPFNGPELLRKISALSVTTYNYKGTTEKHIGPVAEEFVGAFDTGVIRESDGKRDDQYLAGSDVAGVALAGVQELLKKIDQLEKRIAELEANQK
jgi:trimeric autotransporter adhesin